MNIVIGSARISENGSVNGKAGDQKQGTAPDYTGEVSLQSFYVHSKGWIILRPKMGLHALNIAQNMFDLCNNKNAGYAQNDRYGVIRLGVHGTSPFNCDCSSSVRECVREATGIDPGDFTTANEASVLMATGLFEKIEYKAGMEIMVGDILVTKTKGHTVICVIGYERTVGASDTAEIGNRKDNPYKEPAGTIKRGSKGEGVKWIQWELTEAGYDFSGHGGIDGDFGSFTEGCAKAFQKKKNLTIDGIVGKYTRNALKLDKNVVIAYQPDLWDQEHTFGIDVAKWQGVIDWAKVKNDGQQFAVLKITRKDNKAEEAFERNYYGTKSVGMPIAVYRYVYAKNTGEALKEADGIVAALSNKYIEGEVWLDMEDASIRDIGRNTLTKIINTEAAVLRQAGYKVGIYCNRDWYEKVLDGAELSKTYKFWIAKYGKNTGEWRNRSDDPKDIAYAWQYSSKGKVNGISGYVDLNLIY